MRKILAILLSLILIFQLPLYSYSEGGDGNLPSAYVPYKPAGKLTQFIENYSPEKTQISGIIEPWVLKELKVDAKDLVVRNMLIGDFPVNSDGTFVCEVYTKITQTIFILSRKTGKIILAEVYEPRKQFLSPNFTTSAKVLLRLSGSIQYAHMWRTPPEEFVEKIKHLLCQGVSLGGILSSNFSMAKSQKNQEFPPKLSIEVKGFNNDGTVAYIKFTNGYFWWFSEAAIYGGKFYFIPRNVREDFLIFPGPSFKKGEKEIEIPLRNGFGRVRVFNSSVLLAFTLNPTQFIFRYELWEKYKTNLNKLSKNELIALMLGFFVNFSDQLIVFLTTLPQASSVEMSLPEYKNLIEKLGRKSYELVSDYYINQKGDPFAYPKASIDFAIWFFTQFLPQNFITILQIYSTIAANTAIQVLLDLILTELTGGVWEVLTFITDFTAFLVDTITMHLEVGELPYPKYQYDVNYIPPQPVYNSDPNVMIIFDNSGSMLFSPNPAEAIHSFPQRIYNGPFISPSEIFPFDFYAPRYPIPNSKLEEAKEVVVNLIASFKDYVNLGVMLFNRYDGGYLLSPIIDISNEQEREKLIHKIYSISTDIYYLTPLAETMADTVAYFEGKFGYPSPTKYPDQLDIIIVVTDGISNHDTTPQGWGYFGIDWDADGHDPRNNPRCGWNVCYSEIGSDYLDDIAYVIHHRGYRLKVPQGIMFKKAYVYTVGFDVDHPLLEDTAANGGGDYFLASDRLSLKAALYNLIYGNLR